MRASLVREERRPAAPPGQAPLLEAEQEHDLRSPRAGSEKIRDRDAARLIAAGEPKLCALESAEDLFATECAAKVEPVLELVQELGNRLLGAEVQDRLLAHRRALEPVGGAHHRPRQAAHSRRPGRPPRGRGREP